MERRGLAKPAEVAEYLGIDEATLANWRWKRVGPTWNRLGPERGPVRYRWADVEKWLDAQARGPEAA